MKKHVIPWSRCPQADLDVSGRIDVAVADDRHRARFEHLADEPLDRQVRPRRIGGHLYGIPTNVRNPA